MLYVAGGLSYLYAMKPILHLLGDRYKSQQFVKFAERKLKELKIQMDLLGVDIQNRLYRFTTDSVEVHIKSYKPGSVFGYDKIRIISTTGVEKKCKANFTFTISGLVVTFTSDLELPATRTFWNWGDGSYDELTSNPVDHTYEQAGSYRVTLKGYEVGPGGGSDVIITGVHEVKTPSSSTSNVAAHALYAAASWTVTGGAQTSEYSVNFTTGPDAWEYDGARMTMTLSLQDIAGYDAIVANKAFVFVTGNYLRWFETGSSGARPIVETVSGSELDLTMMETGVSSGVIAGEIGRSVPLVESVISIVDSSGEPYGILTDPNPSAKNGWDTYAADPEVGRIKVRAYTCIGTKSKTVTVS